MERELSQDLQDLLHKSQQLTSPRMDTRKQLRLHVPGSPLTSGRSEPYLQLSPGGLSSLRSSASGLPLRDITADRRLRDSSKFTSFGSRASSALGPRKPYFEERKDERPPSATKVLLHLESFSNSGGLITSAAGTSTSAAPLEGQEDHVSAAVNRLLSGGSPGASGGTMFSSPSAKSDISLRPLPTSTGATSKIRQPYQLRLPSRPSSSPNSRALSRLASQTSPSPPTSPFTSPGQNAGSLPPTPTSVVRFARLESSALRGSGSFGRGVLLCAAGLGGDDGRASETGTAFSSARRSLAGTARSMSRKGMPTTAQLLKPELLNPPELIKFQSIMGSGGSGEAEVRAVGSELDQAVTGLLKRLDAWDHDVVGGVVERFNSEMSHALDAIFTRAHPILPPKVLAALNGKLGTHGQAKGSPGKGSRGIAAADDKDEQERDKRRAPSSQLDGLKGSTGSQVADLLESLREALASGAGDSRAVASELHAALASLPASPRAPARPHLAEYDSAHLSNMGMLTGFPVVSPEGGRMYASMPPGAIGYVGAAGLLAPPSPGSPPGYGDAHGVFGLTAPAAQYDATPPASGEPNVARPLFQDSETQRALHDTQWQLRQQQVVPPAFGAGVAGYDGHAAVASTFPTQPPPSYSAAASPSYRVAIRMQPFVHGSSRLALTPASHYSVHPVTHQVHASHEAAMSAAATPASISFGTRPGPAGVGYGEQLTPGLVGPSANVQAAHQGGAGAWMSSPQSTARSALWHVFAQGRSPGLPM